MMKAQLADIAVKSTGWQDSQSGLQTLFPRIWGSFLCPFNAKIAVIVIHPTSNFMGHYLLRPLAERGIAALGLNTRYLGNDSILLLERAIQDLGAGVKWLRAKGFDRIVLIGNSGGGALVSLYQSQAESLTNDRTVGGDPIELTPQDLPPAEAIVLNAAHLLMQKWIDPAVIDEHEPSLSDPSLDMFDEGNGPPYSRAFLERFRTQQIDRLNPIDAWVTERLTTLRSVQCGYRDQAFVIHRTLADPRCLDPG
jgi:hypothetical protein